MSIEPQDIPVYQDTQENYIVNDREIIENPTPPFDNNILVTNDNKSNRLWFNMYYTFDNRILDDENKEISIVWVNAGDEKGLSLATEIEVIQEENRLTFAWDVPIQATHIEGTVYFAVRITSKQTETTGEPTYVWNSLAGSVIVRKGLVTDEFNELDNASYPPGWVDYIEGKYKIALTKISQADYETLEIKDSYTLYLVEDTSHNITQYLGTLPVGGGGSPVNTGLDISMGIVSATSTSPIVFSGSANGTSCRITVKAGTVYRCPDGFNADGTRKYVDVTVDTDIVETVANGNYKGRQYVFLNADKTLTLVPQFTVLSYADWDVGETNTDVDAIAYRIVDNKLQYDPVSGYNYYITSCLIGFISLCVEAGTSGANTYNGKKAEFSTPCIVGLDTINTLINNKPGVAINDSLYRANTKGQFLATNCSAFGSTSSHTIFGKYNIASGYSNTINIGTNNVVNGYLNTIDTTMPSMSDDSRPVNNFINGNNNTIEGINTVQDNLISGRENAINLASSNPATSSFKNGLMVGKGLKCYNDTQHSGTTTYDGLIVLGKYNADTVGKIFVLGNGTAEYEQYRVNAVEVDENNNMTVAGTINITDNSTSIPTVIDLLAKIKELEQRINTLENG